MRLLKITAGVLLIFTGIFCFGNPGATILSIAFVLGSSMLLSGISGILAFIKIRDKQQISVMLISDGILAAILGILALANRLDSDGIVSAFFGIWVIQSGILRVSTALGIKKADIRIHRWLFVQGLISIAAGIYAFFNSTLLNLPIVIMVGIFFIIEGINVLTTGVILAVKKRSNPAS